MSAAERDAGVRAGVGLAFYIEPTNMGPSPLCGMVGIRSGGFDVCQVRMEPSGHVTLFTGQTPMGQGVEAALGSICADALTLPFEDVTVVHGDTRSSAYTGYSSGGSRGAGVGGSAALLATNKVKAKLLLLAAHLLAAPVDELELVQGGVQLRSDPVRRVSVAQLAQAAYLAGNLPPGMEAGLEERAAFDPPALGISYGVALVELEVQADTDRIQLRRILFGHDCGPQIRPEIVEGQVIGGIVQGIGATLYEEMEYDDQARPLVHCLRDYELPLAGDVPPIELVHLENAVTILPARRQRRRRKRRDPGAGGDREAVRDALGDAGTAEMVNSLPLRV